MFHNRLNRRTVMRQTNTSVVSQKTTPASCQREFCSAHEVVVHATHPQPPGVLMRSFALLTLINQIPGCCARTRAKYGAFALRLRVRHQHNQGAFRDGGCVFVMYTSHECNILIGYRLRRCRKRHSPSRLLLSISSPSVEASSKRLTNVKSHGFSGFGVRAAMLGPCAAMKRETVTSTLPFGAFEHGFQITFFGALPSITRR